MAQVFSTRHSSFAHRGMAFFSAIALSSSLIQLVAPTPAIAAPLATTATPVVIRPATIAKADFSDVTTKLWYQLLETPGASGAFVTGPGAPPAGVGSYDFTAGGSGGGYFIGTIGYNGTRLDALTKLTYQTYIDPGSANNDPIALNIGVDSDGTDGLVGFQGNLVFVPSFAGTLTPAVWQSWDALANTASWFATRNPR